MPRSALKNLLQEGSATQPWRQRRVVLPEEGLDPWPKILQYFQLLEIHESSCLTGALQLRARRPPGALTAGKVIDHEQAHKWNLFPTWLSRPAAASAS